MGGFTLIEILTAIFILALIVTALMGTYRGVLSDVSRLDSRLKTYQMAQVCLNRIAADLQSLVIALPPAYKPPDLTGPSDPYRLVGTLENNLETDIPSLRFTALTYVAKAAEADALAEITYYVEATDEDTFLLKRAMRPYPFEDPFEPKVHDPILCTSLSALQFQFQDEHGQDHSYWDSDTEDFGYATPQAVSVSLVLKDDGTDTYYHILVGLPLWRKETT